MRFAAVALFALIGSVPAASAQFNPPRPNWGQGPAANGQRREDDRRHPDYLNTAVRHGVQGLSRAAFQPSPRVPPPVMHVPPVKTASRSVFAGLGVKAAGCGVLAFFAWIIDLLCGRKPDDTPPAA